MRATGNRQWPFGTPRHQWLVPSHRNPPMAVRHAAPPMAARRGVKTTMRAPRCTEGRACKPVLSQLDEHMFLRTVPLVPRTQNRVVEPLGRRFDELHSKPELLA